MENKSNEATPLRPQGDRILNAAMVEMDLNKFKDQIKSEATWQERSHNSITIFKSDALRMVLIGMHKDAEIKTHQTNAHISVQVIEGCIQFTAEDQSVILNKGQMVALQPKILHSVIASEESFFLLTFATQG